MRRHVWYSFAFWTRSYASWPRKITQLLKQTLAGPPPPQAEMVFRPRQATKVSRKFEAKARSAEFIVLYAVKLLFADAVDAIENLLIYSTKPAIAETNENESLRAGEISNLRMPLKEQLDSPP